MSESYVRIAGSVTPKGQDPIDIGQNVECDGIVKVEVEIAAAAALTEVLLSGVTDDADVVFVSITADEYTDSAVPGTPDVSYTVETNATTEILLGGPHLYSAGMDAGLGLAGEVFSKIFVNNAHATDAVKLTIIVAFNI